MADERDEKVMLRLVAALWKPAWTSQKDQSNIRSAAPVVTPQAGDEK